MRKSLVALVTAVGITGCTSKLEHVRNDLVEFRDTVAAISTRADTYYKYAQSYLLINGVKDVYYNEFTVNKCTVDGACLEPSQGTVHLAQFQAAVLHAECCIASEKTRTLFLGIFFKEEQERACAASRDATNLQNMLSGSEKVVMEGTEKCKDELERYIKDLSTTQEVLAKYEKDAYQKYRGIRIAVPPPEAFPMLRDKHVRQLVADEEQHSRDAVALRTIGVRLQSMSDGRGGQHGR